MAKKKSALDPKTQNDAPARPRSTLSTAKAVVVKAAEKVAAVVSRAVGAVEAQVVQPAAKAVDAEKKPKKAKVRFVRGKKEAKSETPPVPLPSRSTTSAGKMMSKGMKLPPKDKAAGPPKRGKTT